jgi:hypothetical protein
MTKLYWVQVVGYPPGVPLAFIAAGLISRSSSVKSPPGLGAVEPTLTVLDPLWLSHT